jgi:hypothetical protein
MTQTQNKTNTKTKHKKRKKNCDVHLEYLFFLYNIYKP